MSQRYWFKAKRYGYGWYPATWQGFLVMFGFLALTFWSAFNVRNTGATGRDFVIQFVPILIFNLVALLVICVLTGEKAKWRWGKRD